jgi:hypothetical protein
MGAAARRADRSEQHEKSSTAEEAARRIDALRHVYDEGYITQTVLETMVQSIRARVKRSADHVGHRR